MTKQQIFSLYLANENQKVEWQDENGNEWTDALCGVRRNSCFIDTDKRTIENSLELTKLILKSITNITDASEIIEHDLLTGKIIYESRKPAVKYDDFQQAINEHQEWLITHGYALDVTYFTNGIAIKESKHE